MVNLPPVIGGCHILPPETTLTIGYHPETNVVLVMFNNPNEKKKGFYWPVTVEDAQRMGEMLLQCAEMANRPARLDS